MKEVLGFMMRTGETLLAEITESNEDEQVYTIHKPAVIIPNQEGNVQIVKWNPFTSDEQDYTIGQRDFIATPFEPVKQLVDAYIQATTNIQLATPDQLKNVTAG